MKTIRIPRKLYIDLVSAEQELANAKCAIVEEAIEQLGREDVEYDDENFLVVGDGFENEYPEWEIV